MSLYYILQFLPKISHVPRGKIIFYFFLIWMCAVFFSAVNHVGVPIPVGSLISNKSIVNFKVSSRGPLWNPMAGWQTTQVTT